MAEVKHLDFLSGVKEIMEGFLPGGIAKSELYLVKIIPDALERKRQKLKQEKNPEETAVQNEMTVV